jgi:hypothetical protein
MLLPELWNRFYSLEIHILFLSQFIRPQAWHIASTLLFTLLSLSTAGSAFAQA